MADLPSPEALDAGGVAIVALIGLVGGVAGGLLGLGGSVAMIPLLTFAFGPDQQLYQAACLLVNVAVGIIATVRHVRGGSVRGDLLRAMVPLAAVGAFLGVLLSNALDGRRLLVLFGLFLLYTAASELLGLLRRRPEPEGSPAVPAARTQAMAAVTGISSGLLGIGGGTLLMPLLRRLGRLPLRQAIGTSSAVTIVAATVAAIAKNAALPGLVRDDGATLALGDSLTLAAVLGPTAVAGGFLGAALTYRLPVPTIRLVFLVLLAFAGLRMAMLGMR